MISTWGLLNLAVQSIQVHTMSLCGDANACEIDSCYHVPHSLKPIRKVCCYLLNILATENMSKEVCYCVISPIRRNIGNKQSMLDRDLHASRDSINTIHHASQFHQCAGKVEATHTILIVHQGSGNKD